MNEPSPRGTPAASNKGLRLPFSIRYRLLMLGALATASIWAGAFIQYLHLREQTQELVAVRQNLAFADRFASVARFAAQERGLTNGVLASREGSAASLSDVRQKLDRSIAQLAVPEDLAGLKQGVPDSVTARLEQLVRLRGRIDRRELERPEAFAYFTDLIESLNDNSSRRLADAMVPLGMQYEYVNWLNRSAELLAQLRGLGMGVISGGQMPPKDMLAIDHRLVLFEDALRGFDRSVPDEVRGRLVGAIDAPAVRETSERIRRLLLLQRLDALANDPTAWWTQASEGVDTLRAAAQQESATLSAQADARIADNKGHLEMTVLTLLALGIVTLGLVLLIVGRMFNGLQRLMQGLGRVTHHGDFDARLDDSKADEFGAISNGINQLIEIAGAAVQKQKMLSLIDPLTGILNRRGFDQQLAARTMMMRSHLLPLSLVMIDLDHFKLINDTLGHASGDTVLRQLGSLLASTLRPDDVVARLGGEEFVALLPGCNMEEALEVAEKLRAAVAAFDFGIGRPVTATLGVAQWGTHATPDALIVEADRRLYEAKMAGRNRVYPASFGLTAV